MFLTNPLSVLCLFGTGWSSGSVGRMSQWRWGHRPLRPKFRWVRLVIFLLYYYCSHVLFHQKCSPFFIVLFETTPCKIILLVKRASTHACTQSVQVKRGKLFCVVAITIIWEKTIIIFNILPNTFTKKKEFKIPNGIISHISSQADTLYTRKN